MSLLNSTSHTTTPQEDVVVSELHDLPISLTTALRSQWRASVHQIHHFFQTKPHRRVLRKLRHQASWSSSSNTTLSFEEMQELYIAKYGRQAAFYAMREGLFD